MRRSVCGARAAVRIIHAALVVVWPRARRAALEIREGKRIGRIKTPAVKKGFLNNKKVRPATQAHPTAEPAAAQGEGEAARA